MSDKPQGDWNPRSDTVLEDQMAAYDEMRQRCPVAHSEYLHWSLLRHDDVMHALNDHQTFSNAASSYLSVPNGMDPPEHTEYMLIIEQYFTPQRMQDFEPMCRSIAVNLVKHLPTGAETELMTVFAQNFA